MIEMQGVADVANRALPPTRARMAALTTVVAMLRRRPDHLSMAALTDTVVAESAFEFFWG